MTVSYPSYHYMMKDNLPDRDVLSLRCFDCGHEYRAARPEYICPKCSGDVGIAPMGSRTLAPAT